MYLLATRRRDGRTACCAKPPNTPTLWRLVFYDVREKGGKRYRRETKIQHQTKKKEKKKKTKTQK